MKKNVLFGMMALAMGAMTACSVEEVVDQAETNYIGFDPFANKVSRGLTADQFGHQNFAVWGKYDNVEVFKGKEVSWQDGTSSGSWTYSPLVPWVSGKDYVFAAIAPAVTGASYSYENEKYTLGEITIDATSEKQIDYMTADVQKNVQSTSGTVSFTFNHIASKIDFNFQPKIAENNAWTSDVKIEIKKITLSGVHTKNTYTADNWTGSSITGNFEKEGASGGVYGTTTYENKTVAQLKDQFSWLVVPQDNTDASSRKLTITFDLYTKDADGSYNVKNLENKEASVVVTEEWSANTHYTYTVYIGTDVLGENAFITFDVKEVKGWTTSADNNIDVTAPSTQQGN